MNEERLLNLISTQLTTIALQQVQILILLASEGERTPFKESLLEAVRLQAELIGGTIGKDLQRG